MTRSLRIAAAAAVTVLALGAAGCGSSGQHTTTASPSPTLTLPTQAAGQSPLPTGQPGTPKAGLPSHVDQHDATALAAAAVTTDWTWDTDLDTSPADAQRRSAAWLTPEYAAQVQTQAPVSAPGADWTQLAAHHGYTTVKLARAYDDPSPDTPTSAWREYRVTVSEHGRDGWTGPSTVYVQFAHLVRSDASAVWRVSEMRVTQ